MNTRWLLTLTLAAAVGAGLVATQPDERAHLLQHVSLRKMADSLHAVIAANRSVYFQIATEEAHRGRLPVHAEVLRQANFAIQTEGAEFSYTLRSLEPINPRQGPQTEIEQRGLRRVAEHPDEPYTTEEMLGGRSYYTAIYAERATFAACVECHNAHPDSPRRDYQLGDVLGAVVVRIPLEF
jgi:hypothetical protein